METKPLRRGQNEAERPRLHGSAGVVATACRPGEQTQHGRPIPAGNAAWCKPRRVTPTGRPRGTGRAGVGVGPAHSTEEAGNDRGGKGPELKGQCRKQRGRKESDDESSTSGEASEVAGDAARQSQGRAEPAVPRLVRQGVPRGRAGPRLCLLPGQRRRGGRGRLDVRGHRGVRAGALAGRSGGNAEAVSWTAPCCI